MPPRWNENRLTAKLGIDYPIVQGPLGGLSSQRIDGSGLQFWRTRVIRRAWLSPRAIKDVIAEIRSLTSKPFAMNLWVSMEDEGARTSDKDAFNRSLAPLAAHIAGLGARAQSTNPIRGCDLRIKPASCSMKGYRSSASSTGFHHAKYWKSAGKTHRDDRHGDYTPEESAAIQDAGVDAIVASGFEAGGDIAVHSSVLQRIHLQGTFLSYLRLPTRSICR